MDGKGHHLRDGWEAGDGTVIRRVFSVTILEDEDRPSFEEPIILLIPLVLDLSFDTFFTIPKTAFLDGGHFLIGKE